MVRDRGLDIAGPVQDWMRAKFHSKRWTAKQFDDYFQRLNTKGNERERMQFFVDELRAPQTTPLPPIWTVRRALKRWAIPDDSDTWSPIDSGTAAATGEVPAKVSHEWLTPKPEDLRTVFDVLAWVTLETEGKKTTLTKAEVDWIIKIAKAAPSAGSRIIWRLVQHYMEVEAKGESTEALDAYLAYKPWESANRCMSYSYALRRGWIKEVPGRPEIDGLYGLSVGSLDKEFDRRVNQPFDPLDAAPLLMRRTVLYGPGMDPSEEELVIMESIRKDQPELYQRMLNAWDNANEKEDTLRSEHYKNSELRGKQLMEKHPDVSEDQLRQLWVESGLEAIHMAEEEEIDGVWDEFADLILSYKEKQAKKGKKSKREGKK